MRVFGSRNGPGAVRVAGCESMGDTTPPIAIDPAARNGPHAGAFQINVEIHAARIARLGYSPAQMFELEPNAVVAKNLHDEQGWGPWTCGWAA